MKKLLLLSLLVFPLMSVGESVTDHFADMRKIVSFGSGSQREKNNYILMCYLAI